MSGYSTLPDGRRLLKHDTYFDVLGNIEELYAQIGIVCTIITDKNINMILRTIQNKLNIISTDIGTCKNRENMTQITQADVADIQTHINKFTQKSPLLVEIILLGHNQSDEYFRLCKATCRRLERSLWKLRSMSTLLVTEQETFQYIDRLGEFFISLAHFVSHCRLKMSENNLGKNKNENSSLSEKIEPSR